MSISYSSFEVREKSLSPSARQRSANPIPECAIVTQSDIVKLNIGGRLFVTTKTTLLSRGNNFFKPLVTGEFSSIKDEQGAFFIDRNGDYFAPILDYLRCGNLLIPSELKLEAIFEEANFYSIDLAPGLCGDIKEGLYTSSNWILFLDRDPDHPWIFGITGVEERGKQAYFQEVCVVKDGAIHWRDNEIYSIHGKVYIWNRGTFKSKTQLFYRCSRSEKFPLSLQEVLESDRTFDGEHVSLTFSSGPQGLQVRSSRPAGIDGSKPYSVSRVLVLCKSLLIMHNDRDGDWLLYSHSDLAFFTFDHPYLEFSDSFHLTLGSSSKQATSNSNNNNNGINNANGQGAP